MSTSLARRATIATLLVVGVFMTAGSSIAAAAPVADDDDGRDTTTWIVIALVAAGLLIVIGIIWANAAANADRRRLNHRRAAHRINHVVGGAIWVHDQLSLELMVASTQSPAQLQMKWQDGQRRINDLSNQCSIVAMNLPDDMQGQPRDDVFALGHAVTGLTGALDTNVALRADGQSDVAAVSARQESDVAVSSRRNELAVAIAAARRHT